MTLRLGVLGIDHGHIFGMLANMKAQGCTCAQYWTDGPAVTEQKFNQVFPEVAKVADRRAVLDSDVDMVLISAVPADRAALAIEAMRAGKDVMVDKPGCTTLEQLAEIKQVQAETGRIWSVNFSERFEVRATTRASELVAEGAIGRVIQVVTLAPHKQNLKTRPPWYFQRARYGGILCDIGSHQVDQFLHFTGSTEVQVGHALVENTTMPAEPGFQDFGEMTLVGDKGHGYLRLDWFTPDGLPTWGDGRLFLLGTEGTIECRKYTEIGQPHRTDNLYLVNGSENRHIDCSDAELPYFPRLVADVQARSWSAAPQEHTFRTMQIAITAQMKAEGQDA
ncbi:Oxidoreductase [Candidatus Rhodobacter oscarellae]|uniref:Oxidoreductase n=1 Tax=Candidatus Rhodobacter oscarellae TaxID=1675527 RepID=A0A0J9EFU5_9RHOB|nr:Gfo/Idh/MocA family oxidoreductase [Candidatus Rhodobacter lobularis]KMW60559.1 Oxidoreductase [Candidatus Rhodobacter lobularis]